MDLDDQRVLLARKLAIQRQRLALVQANGLAFYRPFPKQAMFHEAGNFKHRMMRSGNRFGKSTMGCAEDCAWLTGERAWYPKDSPFRTLGIPQHPVKGLVVTTDWDKVDEIWTSKESGKLFRMLPQGWVKSTHRNHSGAIDEVIGHNKSLIRFDTVESFKKNEQGSESSDWDFNHYDEPCPQAMYKAVSRGLMDRGGKDWFTLTPLQEIWINDMFFPNGPRPANIWAEVGSTRDNPHLSPTDIDEYEANLSAEERQCRIEGLPLELAGLVYKEFSTAKHVLTSLPPSWRSWDCPPHEWTHYAAIDPHPRTPHAVLFVAVSPLGTPIVYDEIFFNFTSFDLAQAVLKKLSGRNCAPVKCDPIAWIEDPVTGASMQKEFAKSGLIVHKASKAKEHGILHMRSIFKDPLGVRFVPTVHRTLWELSRYCYDKENKPIDKDDHMMECMYRLFINNPCYVDFSDSSGMEQVAIDPTTSYSLNHDPFVSARSLIEDLNW